METESESSSLGDDSVFWMDSEVITQLTDDEDEEREENFRKMKSSIQSEEDDFVPELHRNVHPRERPDWEETLSAMARGADVPEIPGDLTLKACGSTASMKVKHVKKLPFTKGHFPKMAECAHFHYENVEFGSIQLSLSEEQNEVMKNGCESKELVYLVQIACQGKSWIVKRSYEDFRVLDKHLHLCIYDRRFSQLSELPRSDMLKDSPESVTQMLMAYLSRLSTIAGNKINCGPALTWMEIDNKGNHLLVHEESSINTPAVGAAHVIKRYTARAPDELTLEVGDIVSVIDMPPKVLSTWWRGKHGFQVGLFPGHCVELINQKVPQSVTNSVPKPVSKKHGKLITFLRTFMKSRPTKQKLKQRGILKERVFGCDLGEHLLNSGFEASLSRPKSLLVSSPSTKLLTLEEAQARTQAQVTSPIVTENKYIEVGEGPAALQGKFHTIIEFPLERKRPQNKMKKSPVGSWRSFFNLGKSSSVSKRKLQRNESEPSEMKAMALKGGRAEGTLRSAKSEESLTSLHAVDGDSKLFRPRRPRSSSDALSASFNGEMLGNRCNSYDNLPHDNESEEEVGLLHIPALVSPHSAEDVDLSPPDIGVASLDFDPMSFQCSPPKAESECLESGASFLDSLGFARDQPSTSKKDVDAGGSQSQTPGSTASSEPVSPVQEKLSPFFTLDLSPTEDKSSKPSSFTEKVVYAFSPKIGRKLSKSPSINISEPISVTLPARVSEVIGTASSTVAQNASPPSWDKSADERDVLNSSPTQIGKMKGSKREAQEGCEPEVQPLEQGAAEEVEFPGKEALPVPSSQSKAVPAGQSQTGAVTHDPPQDPVPVSSVSLIPPPPPPKNVARMLALALAESAQQASSTQTLKRPGATSQAGCPSYGDMAVLTAEEKLPGSYSSITLDKTCFQTDRPAEQFHLQLNGLGNCDQPLPGTAAMGDPTHSNTADSGEHLHQVDLIGNPLQRNQLSGDPEKVSSTSAPLTDSGKSDDHGSFPEDQAGKPSKPTVSFVEQDQAPLHLSSGGQAPPSLGTGVDKPHHPSELADRFPMSSTLPRDKSHPLSGSPEENTSTATVSFMTATPARGETSASDTSRVTAEQPTAADFVAATLQRAHRTNRPLPPPPSQRPAEQPPALGQVQEAPSVGLSNCHKVQGAAPERPAEPPATSDPASIFICDGSAAAQCPMAASAPQPGLPEKVREGTRAPLLHLRAESFPGHSCGFAAPTPPTRTVESKMAAAMHATTADANSGSNYHSFVPSSASLDDGLPLPLPISQPKHASQKIAYSSFARPDVATEPFGPENCLHFNMTPNCQFRPQSVPPHHNKVEPHQVYGARSEPPASMGPRYNTYVAPGRNMSGHHSKPCSGVEYVSSLGSSVRNACCPEDILPYPTIRRVQSLHAPPPSMIRSVPISRTEVPPDDEPVYCPRPVYQYKPYQSSQARSDYHVTQLQPYFENGRVHYRYSPYSSSSSSYYSPDGALCDVDAYGTVQLRPLHRLSNRDYAFYNPRLQGKNLYSYAGLPPRPRANMTGYFSGNDHNVVNMPPTADVKHTYASWDLEDMEKYRMQSIRRESRARQKVKGPVMSQYDNMTPAVQDDLGGIYVIHLRSKSDPGKTGLLSVAEGKERRPPAKAVSPEGDDRFYRKHPEPEFDRAHHHGGYGSTQVEKPSLPQKQSSLRNRKLHDMGCSLPEHRAHQEASHRQLCESKNGPSYPQGAGQLDYGPKGMPDTCEPGSYHNSGGKYVTSGQESLRMNHKEVRLSKDLDRPRARHPPAPEKHSRDCYKEEEHFTQSMVPPPKPERSHSLKLHHTQNLERDPSAIYQYPTHSKRQSNMTVVSQYDNLEDYHSLPQHQRGGFGGGGMGAYVPSGFAHPQSRTYATALGQGAFLPTELSLPHADTQIHAE
uniref:Rho GTPase activating protein 32 n=1 Tax=Peromyscus maniculatus bairdii TaxID=230844 RepID=A0A8C8UDJ9_PERMB